MQHIKAVRRTFKTVPDHEGLTEDAQLHALPSYLLHACVISLNANTFQYLLDVASRGAFFACKGSKQVSSNVTHPAMKEVHVNRTILMRTDLSDIKLTLHGGDRKM